MNATEKKYPQVEELGIGKHIITGIKPMPVFEEAKDDAGNTILKDDGTPKKKPVEGTHRTGEFKTGGGWYMYSFKNAEDKFVTLFGNDKNKAWLDSGTVEIAVLHKEVNGEPCYTVVDGNPVPILISFVNQNPVDMVKKAGTPEAKAEVKEAVTPKEEKIEISDLPF